MTDIRETAAFDGDDRAPIFEVTPPRRPAPMPRQTMTFWRPRLSLATTIAILKDFRRPMRMTQRVVVPVPNVDEPG